LIASSPSARDAERLRDLAGREHVLISAAGYPWVLPGARQSPVGSPRTIAARRPIPHLPPTLARRLQHAGTGRDRGQPASDLLPASEYSMREEPTCAIGPPSGVAVVAVQVGCAPDCTRYVSRPTPGQVTTPAPRPLALRRQSAGRSLARKVVGGGPGFAAKRFGGPRGVCLFNPRTKELRPADTATEGTEEPPAELLEQARRYLKWCEGRHQPGDCLGALRGHRTLDAHGRYTVAMGIAIAGTFEATKESLEDMVSVKEVWGWWWPASPCMRCGSS
jgi:hypothetical protein